MKPSQCIHCNYGMVSSLTRGPSDTFISLKNKTGYVWDKDEPSNKNQTQPCIYMMIGGSKVEKKGTLDDIGCLAGSGYFKRAVLCGKKAE
ncbi:unnamed protein product [Caenorhabditis nigoni]